MNADSDLDRIKSRFSPADVPRIFFGYNGAGGGNSPDSAIWARTRRAEYRRKTSPISLPSVQSFSKKNARFERIRKVRRKPITFSGGTFSAALVKPTKSANSTAAFWDVSTSKAASWFARSLAIVGRNSGRGWRIAVQL